MRKNLTILSFFKLLMTPFSPSNTVFTCSVAGSIVITMSESLTASKILFEANPPSLTTLFFLNRKSIPFVSSSTIPNFFLSNFDQRL